MTIQKSRSKSTVEVPATNSLRLDRPVSSYSPPVCGDVFGSPSARHVYGAVKALPSKMGTILIITNCCVSLSFPFVWGIV